MATTPHDEALDAVAAAILDKGDVAGLFGEAVREAFDEVLDGRRTGRWRLDDLEKTEKTYIGTKVEILLGHALAVERGAKMDFSIAGHEVDCKFSLRQSWMIPEEAEDQLCLLVTASDESGLVSSGLLRCHPAILGARNRDKKRGVPAKARSEIRWLVRDEPIPENLLANLSTASLDAIFFGPDSSSGQARVDELFRQVHARIIRREVTVTVARQDDGMKRARDSRRRLQPEGVIVLGHQSEHPRIAQELGLPVPGKGEFVAARVVLASDAEDPGAFSRISSTLWRIAADDDPAAPGPEVPY